MRTVSVNDAYWDHRIQDPCNLEMLRLLYMKINEAPLSGEKRKMICYFDITDIDQWREVARQSLSQLLKNERDMCRFRQYCEVHIRHRQAYLDLGKTVFFPLIVAIGGGILANMFMELGRDIYKIGSDLGAVDGRSIVIVSIIVVLFSLSFLYQIILFKKELEDISLTQALDELYYEELLRIIKE